MTSNTIADRRYRASHSKRMRVITTEGVQTLEALTDTDRLTVGRHLYAVCQYLMYGITNSCLADFDGVTVTGYNLDDNYHSPITVTLDANPFSIEVKKSCVRNRLLVTTPPPTCEYRHPGITVTPALPSPRHSATEVKPTSPNRNYVTAAFLARTGNRHHCITVTPVTAAFRNIPVTPASRHHSITVTGALLSLSTHSPHVQVTGYHNNRVQQFGMICSRGIRSVSGTCMRKVCRW